MSEFIKFRVTEEKAKEYKAQAELAGLSLSAWIISKCDFVATSSVATDKTPEKVVATTPKIIKTVGDAIKQLPPVKPKTSTRWNERPLAPGALLKRK